VLLLLALLLVTAPPGAPATAAGGPAALAPGVPTLSVRDLTASSGGALVPSARALALATTRVRLLGYVVRQEEQVPGGFWLASRPVECDEGGAGTGDLPPGSVRVILAGGPPPADGPVAVTGLLEVGNDPGHDGSPSTFRLRIEPAGTPASPTP
jgi:hypothetical protein